MDSIAADLQAYLGRGPDFVGGIDNEALDDFSQLEDYINNEASQGNSTYFSESLNPSSSTEKLLHVIVENKTNPTGHSLPDSPPDSSSEHPYSPQDTCEQSINSSQNIYTTLGQNLYKPILNPIINDNLILSSHMVVTEQTGEQQILNNSNLLQESNILVGDDIRNSNNLLNNRIIADSINADQSILNERLVLPTDSNILDARQIILNNNEGQSFNDRSLYKSSDFQKNQLVHLSYNHNIDMNLPQNNVENNICEQSIESMQNVYTTLQNPTKKRKLSQDSTLVKTEPEHCSPSQLSPGGGLSNSLDDDYASSEACLSESQYQCIRFSPFLQNQWHTLCDQNLTELPTIHYRVDADKGFNFSNADDAFVCQKKNHFQITCHVQLIGDAQFVKTPDGFQKISSFYIHFYGVKHDCPTQTIRVEQSQSDRSKKPFHPVLIELVNSQVTKVTVGRLHFSETTSNNMRKKGKPNPEQRYFQLVVGLHAHTSSGNFPIVSHGSQRIIVRASNPGQFESDVELCWQKGQTQDSVFHNGKVGINTDRPDESLVVHGNIKVTGHIIQPSDIRAKKNIVECDTATQLKNVQKLRVVRYDYEPLFAAQLSKNCEFSDTGVIAQEVAEVLPEAVSPAGDLLLDNGISINNFLVVNKERIFMENIGAVKELCKVTDNLETRIDQLERMNRRLNKIKRGDSFKSTSTVSSSKIPYSQKCLRHHKCVRDDPEELCSNKFIQIVIVILVLIMALCLVSITALYLTDNSARNRFAQHMKENTQQVLSTTWKPQTSKMVPIQEIYPSYIITTEKLEGPMRNFGSTTLRNQIPIGKPPDCLNVDQDLENSNLCQIYCCATSHIISPLKNAVSLYTDKVSPPRQNESSSLSHDDRENFPNDTTNDIKERQRRNTFDSNDESNSFDSIDDQAFSIVIQGENFNTTLTDKYLVSSSTYNYSYKIPISKYMPDESIYLIFLYRSNNFRDVEYCSNDNGGSQCSHLPNDDKFQVKSRVNSNSQDRPVNFKNNMFVVKVADFQSIFQTYRSPLKQNQNTCKLTKLGSEFIEYNFYFYRQCNE